MIEGLEVAFEPSGETPTPELQRALAEAVGGETALALRVRTFKRGIHRVTLSVRGTERSVVVKRVGIRQARRNEFVIERWLPARDLGRGCPALLGRAAHPRGRFLWHVYEDVGDRTLLSDPPVDRDVSIVVDFLARLHVRFRNDPMLAEARSWGGDLGLPFFATSVADALNGLRALISRGVGAASGRGALCRRIIGELLEPLRDSLSTRAEVFCEHAGPDTLLHGDLWTANAIVADEGERACLIDWDHVGVGPASYDISTLLLRFPATYRPSVVDRYREAVAAEGGSVPPPESLEVLCETAELARYANHLGWLVLVLLEEDSEWAWAEVEEVEGWFRGLGTVIGKDGPDGAGEGSGTA